MPIPKYIELQQQAKRDLAKAGHFLYVTFNLVQESKILVSVVGQIDTAVNNALLALLEFERSQKNIEPFPRHEGMMIQIYEQKVQGRRELDPKFLQLLKRLNSLKEHITNSTMTFKRDNKLVFATDRYDTKSIDIELIKKYYNISGEFVNKVGGIIQNESAQSA